MVIIEEPNKRKRVAGIKSRLNKKKVSMRKRSAVVNPFEYATKLLRILSKQKPGSTSSSCVPRQGQYKRWKTWERQLALGIWKDKMSKNNKVDVHSGNTW